MTGMWLMLLLWLWLQINNQESSGLTPPPHPSLPETGNGTLPEELADRSPHTAALANCGHQALIFVFIETFYEIKTKTDQHVPDCSSEQFGRWQSPIYTLVSSERGALLQSGCKWEKKNRPIKVFHEKATVVIKCGGDETSYPERSYDVVPFLYCKKKQKTACILGTKNGLISKPKRTTKKVNTSHI